MSVKEYVPTITPKIVVQGMILSVAVGAAWYGIRYAAGKVGGPVQTAVEKAASIAE